MYRGLPQARAFTVKAACCSAWLLLTFLPSIAFAGTYSGGSGTEAEPYRISTVLDWKKLMATPADWAAHFILTSDIDLNGVPLTPIAPDTSTDIAFQGTEFTGVFDGNDNVIHNAVVNRVRSDFVGLFGCLGMNGQIRNLGVEDISIVGRRHVGGLAGWNSGTMSNCYSTVSVSARDYVGGLVGNNYGSITNCYSAGVVAEADDLAGGLVGCSGGTISNCYSSGSVSGNEQIGGLVGDNKTTITNCYSTGSVTGDRYVGGLAGTNGGTVSDCYSTGSVVSGTYSVGGLVGYNYGAISNCYSTGSVSGSSSVGGLVGSNYDAVVKSSFWDVNTSGWTTSAGGTPKTTAEMKTQSTFTSAGWDFIEVWDIGENQTYPFLRTYLAGDINHDGVVDFRDITHLAADWLGGVE